MAKIQEVAGLISETLGVRPLDVQRHVRGLTESGWLADGPATSDDAAALLCAVLSTDPVTATAPHDLPFVGAAFFEHDYLIEAGSPEFNTINTAFPDLGSVVSCFIDMFGSDATATDRLKYVVIAGHGKRLRALVQFDAVLFGGAAKPVAVYGYEPVGSLLAGIAARPGYIETSYSIGPQVFADLGRLLSARSKSLERAPRPALDRRELH